jgi:hypothetical protein
MRKSQAIAIIDDTSPLDAPADLIEFSSHLVLWESIAGAILAEQTNDFARADIVRSDSEATRLAGLCPV